MEGILHFKIHLKTCFHIGSFRHVLGFKLLLFYLLFTLELCFLCIWLHLLKHFVDIVTLLRLVSAFVLYTFLLHCCHGEFFVLVFFYYWAAYCLIEVILRKQFPFYFVIVHLRENQCLFLFSFFTEISSINSSVCKKYLMLFLYFINLNFLLWLIWSLFCWNAYLYKYMLYII